MSVEAMQAVCDRALEFGFSHAAVLDVDTLKVLREVRDMCAADKCKAYNRNWVCPPACGSIEENAKAMKAYSRGVVVQTTARMEDEFDVEGIQAAGAKQGELFVAFLKQLKPDYPAMLPLGSGGCSICESCTYPGAPCRNPDIAAPSMESFGLWVSDVCKKNGLEYYYGPNTMTFTSCYLLE